MLNNFRERQEAWTATRGRRIYTYASGAVIFAVVALVVVGLVPAWIPWTTVAASIVLDEILIRKWIREDALKAYRADQAGEHLDDGRSLPSPGTVSSIPWTETNQ